MSQKKNRMFDFEHPFFDPLWVRIVTFVVCVGWGLFELSLGNILWAILFCAGGLFAGYNFFIARKTPHTDN